MKAKEFAKKFNDNPTPETLSEIDSICAWCGVDFSWAGGGRYEVKGVKGYICFLCRDKRHASNWARDVLADKNAVILDTETTGLDSDAQIVEIAVINAAGETLLDTLVKPTMPIPAGATAVHGIGNDDVADAPTFAEVAYLLYPLLEGRRVVIYNADFDTRMIVQSARACNAQLPAANDWECAMEMYAQWYGDWSDYHGNYKWQRLDGGHRALGDCLATLKRIKEMQKFLKLNQARKR